MTITSLLKKSNRLLIKKANELLKVHGITHAYTYFLMELYERDGQKQSEMYKAIGIEQPTAVRTLDRMERDGLIVRWPCPDDRRAIIIKLTKKGKSYEKIINTCSKQLNEQALNGLNNHEKTEMMKNIHQLILNLADD